MAKDVIYAQIKNNVILNSIVLNDPSLVGIFSNGFDSLVQIDQLNPQPSIGWSYDGKNFSPPSPLTQQQLKDEAVASAIPLNTKGDLPVGGDKGQAIVIPAGPENSVLTIKNGVPTWV